MILIYELREFTGLFIEIHLDNVQNLVCKAQKLTVDVYKMDLCANTFVV